MENSASLPLIHQASVIYLFIYLFFASFSCCRRRRSGETGRCCTRADASRGGGACSTSPTATLREISGEAERAGPSLRQTAAAPRASHRLSRRQREGGGRGAERLRRRRRGRFVSNPENFTPFSKLERSRRLLGPAEPSSQGANQQPGTPELISRSGCAVDTQAVDARRNCCSSLLDSTCADSVIN